MLLPTISRSIVPQSSPLALTVGLDNEK
jgi:hypothetical protein